ncbi:hypothetical protein DXG01_002865 [Tephrocybe rancida]|nr:hypothetical protein DXG01_002865 [Tephrocybe rancida]
MISYSNPSSSVAMGELAKVVGSPFNKQETDILCSSDQPTPTDFRVFKSPPALASPFFASVFTLPQPVTDGSYGIPVMQMQEDERTLTLTLGFCFFISVNRPPRLDYLEDIHRVIKAAVKFEMKGVEEYVEAKLLDGFIRDKPFQVFAIACHYGWKREARVAASFSLLPSLFLPETTAAFYEPNLITAATYHRLMQYRRECMTAAGREVIRLIEASDCSSRPWSVDPDQRRVCKGSYFENSSEEKFQHKFQGWNKDL